MTTFRLEYSDTFHVSEWEACAWTVPTHSSWWGVGLADPLDPLLSEESEIVRGAEEKRQREFRAGRMCARRALAGIGAPNGPVLREQSGAPLWPPGYLGSISHCESFAWAVVSGSINAVGIDVERVRDPFPWEILNLFCGAAEEEHIMGYAERERGVRALAVFSLKESVIKCFGARGVILDFREISVLDRIEVHGMAVQGHARVSRCASMIATAVWW
jgi:4'-phosphopantetheinyl transferase EntD